MDELSKVRDPLEQKLFIKNVCKYYTKIVCLIWVFLKFTESASWKRQMESLRLNNCTSVIAQNCFTYIWWVFFFSIKLKIRSSYVWNIFISIARSQRKLRGNLCSTAGLFICKSTNFRSYISPQYICIHTIVLCRPYYTL